MVCRSCPANPLHPGILLKLLPNVRNSCFLMRSSYHTVLYVCQPITCASFILLSLFANLKCNICTVSRNHFLLSATQKFQFYTIYAIFLIMWYIKCIFEIHIMLPMTYDMRLSGRIVGVRSTEQSAGIKTKGPETLKRRSFLCSGVFSFHRKMRPMK